MINVYGCDISVLFHGEWEQYLPLLPPQRQERAQRYRREEDAARCVGAWLLLREVLRREGTNPDAVTFRQGTFGKPFLEGGPEFSLSHAGSYAVAAVSDHAVGVDVEAAGCTMEIARAVFAPSEVEAAALLSDEAQRLFLQRLWVAKEAFVKALGTGLSTPLDSFGVLLREDAAEIVQDITPTPLYVSEYSAGAYRIAVVGHERDAGNMLWLPCGGCS